MAVKPFQVAVSPDLDLPYHKWHCLGTCWAPTPRSAAYDTCRGRVNGDVVAAHSLSGLAIFEFPGSVFIRVGFGS